MKAFLVLFFLWPACWSFAQYTPPVSENKPSVTSSPAPKRGFVSLNRPFVPITQTFGVSNPEPFVLLGDTDHLPGFFCKLEYKLESRSKLAPRFRLGSLNYTEWMEGKGEWYHRFK